MKKLCLLFVVAICCYAQSTPTKTPNLGLYIPAHGSFNWDAWYNLNWKILDNAVTAFCTDARVFGVSNTNTDNYADIWSAITYAAGTTGNGCVILPYGDLFISQTLVIPTGVRVYGHGWANPSEFSNPPVNTTLKATITPAFSTPAALGYPSKFIAAIDGAGGEYGARLEWVGLDCNGVAHCSAMMTAHANEMSGFAHIVALNFSDYGWYVCGGWNPQGTCSTNGGAQGDGPNEDLEFIGSNYESSSTVPIMINGWLGGRAVSHITITSNAPPYAPAVAGIISGIQLTIGDIHTEGTLNGFQVAPPSGPYCSSNCNVSVALKLSNINLTFTNGTTGSSTITATNIQSSFMDDIYGPPAGYGITFAGVHSEGNVGYAGWDAWNNVCSNDPNLGCSQKGSIIGKDGIKATGTGTIGGEFDIFNGSTNLSRWLFDLANSATLRRELYDGFLVQRDSGTGTQADGGLWLGGVGDSANVFAGAKAVGGVYTALENNVVGIKLAGGCGALVANSGLTIGNTFIPTTILSWCPSGSLLFNATPQIPSIKATTGYAPIGIDAAGNLVKCSSVGGCTGN